MAIRASNTSPEISVMRLETGTVACLVLGKSPLIFNRMAEKAKRELLLPKGRKTAADKAQTLKHNPTQEFRDSVYKRLDDGPTRLIFPAPAFKGAMTTAALEVPGMKRAQIGRLVWVEGTHVDVYGVPEVLVSVVRNQDINRTPDIRTRAIIREWACVVPITFTMPQLTAKAVASLMQAAGLVVGVGDFRQEKAKGNFGQFLLVDQENADFQRIVAEGGLEVQDRALAEARPYDLDSQEMLDWYSEELNRRGIREAA